jgi:hypothetical protein
MEVRPLMKKEIKRVLCNTTLNDLTYLNEQVLSRLAKHKIYNDKRLKKKVYEKESSQGSKQQDRRHPREICKQ